MKPSLASLMQVISAAIRYGRFESAINRLPGAPHLAAIKSSAYYRIKAADEMAAKAAQMRDEALKDFTNDLQSDWSAKDIYKAFNE